MKLIFISLSALLLSLGVQIGIFSPGAFVPQHGGTGSIVATGKTCGNTVAGVTTATCTWSANPAVGESLHCGAWRSGNSGTFSISDNGSGGSNTYTQNGSTFVLTSVSSFIIAIWDSFHITKSISTTTISDIAGGGATLNITCFSTTGGTGAVDGAAGTYQNSSTASISVPVDPTGSADLAYFYFYTNKTVTPCSGCTNVGGSPGIVYTILNTSGSQNITATLSSSYFGAIGGTDK
jgi:hypothetical protein